MKGLSLFENLPDSDIEKIAVYAKILHFEAHIFRKTKLLTNNFLVNSDIWNLPPAERSS